MTGTLEFGAARAVVERTLGQVAVAAESPKVEDDFALESEFQADVTAAARHAERLAQAVAATLERAAGDASGDGDRERLGRLAAAERSHADLYRPITAGDGSPGPPEPWEALRLGVTTGPLNDVAVFWGVVGPFLVLDAGRFAGSVYGPLSRAATAVVQAWARETAAGLERIAALSRDESGRAAVAAVADAALPLVRGLAEAASGDVAVAWSRRGVTGPEPDADRQALGTYAESAAAWAPR